MDPRTVERKLVAIMFTDIVGYTALMAKSEESGLAARARHRTLVRPLIERYHGDTIEAKGDELLSVFPNALDAVNCALAILGELAVEPVLKLHIGIHLGDVLLRDGEISGDGVNVAARICALSDGSSVYVSGELHQAVSNQPNIQASPLGEQSFKNVPRPVAVHALTGEARPPAPRIEIAARRPALRRISAFAIVAVLAALAWWSVERPVTSPGRIASVAVLPLDHISGIPDDEYFTEGMHDAVISELGKVATLRVISRTTMLRYSKSDKSVPEIARELGVDAVVEGSVLRVGDRVRITAQLIRAGSDEHLWADSYERDMRDVLGLQRDVAVAIAGRIEGVLTPQDASILAPPRPVNPEAYDAYLKGRHLMRLAIPGNRKKGAAYFERAIALDPSYAPAYAGLADAVT